MTAIHYESMDRCERDRATIISEVETSKYITSDGAALEQIAVVCAETVKP